MKKTFSILFLLMILVFSVNAIELTGIATCEITNDGIFYLIVGGKSGYSSDFVVISIMPENIYGEYAESNLAIYSGNEFYSFPDEMLLEVSEDEKTMLFVLDNLGRETESITRVVKTPSITKFTFTTDESDFMNSIVLSLLSDKLLILDINTINFTTLSQDFYDRIVLRLNCDNTTKELNTYNKFIKNAFLNN